MTIDHRMRYRDEIRRIYKLEGLNGFTKGYFGLIMRDIITLSFYFFIFNKLKLHFNAQ